MKTSKLKIMMALSLLAPLHPAMAQSAEVTQLLLNVEKLSQMKQILSQMKRNYAVLTRGYGLVRDLSQGNFSLHSTFLKGLMRASPAVRSYRSLKEIAGVQARLVSLGSRGMARLRDSRGLTPGELEEFYRIHRQILETSLASLQQLTPILLDGALQMNDGERMRAIDRILGRMQGCMGAMVDMLEAGDLLILQRRKEIMESVRMEGLLGLEKHNSRLP